MLGWVSWYDHSYCTNRMACKESLREKIREGEWRNGRLNWNVFQ